MFHRVALAAFLLTGLWLVGSSLLAGNFSIAGLVVAVMLSQLQADSMSRRLKAQEETIRCLSDAVLSEERLLPERKA